MIDSALLRLAVLGVGLAAAIGFGYVQGVSRESDRRDAQELKQKKADDRERGLIAAFGNLKSGEASAQRRRANGYYRNLQERIDHAPPDSLATMECPPAAVASGGSTPPPSPAVGSPVVLFSPGFVSLYNAAWAGAGTRIPDDPAGSAGATGGAAPADPQEILTHTRAETQSCGDDRRRYLKLIEFLERPTRAAAAPGDVSR